VEWEKDSQSSVVQLAFIGLSILDIGWHKSGVESSSLGPMVTQQKAEAKGALAAFLNELQHA
jgi:hypothetical protein